MPTYRPLQTYLGRYRNRTKEPNNYYYLATAFATTYSSLWSAALDISLSTLFFFSHLKRLFVPSGPFVFVCNQAQNVHTSIIVEAIRPPIMQVYNKKIRFSETSQLFIVPDLTNFAEEVLWYCGDDIDSFKASYLQSIAEIRIKFSRGDVNGIRASEILGMEKHLTQDVSYHIGFMTASKNMAWSHTFFLSFPFSHS